MESRDPLVGPATSVVIRRFPGLDQFGSGQGLEEFALHSFPSDLLNSKPVKVPPGVRDVKQNMPLFVGVEVKRSSVLGLQSYPSLVTSYFTKFLVN